VRRRLTPVEEHIKWLDGLMPSQAIKRDAEHRRKALAIEAYQTRARRSNAASRARVSSTRQPD
jgi:hypothetical protein